MRKELPLNIPLTEYFYSIAHNYPPLKNSVARSFVEDYQTTGNEESLEMLIFSNMRMLTRIANYKIALGARIPFEDLIQAGTLGIIKSAKKFDLGRGKSTFFTYAWSAAYRDMDRAIAKETGIKQGVGKKISLVRDAAYEYELENGAKAKGEDIMARTGLSQKQMRVIAFAHELGRATSLDRAKGKMRPLESNSGKEKYSREKLWQIAMQVREELDPKRAMVFDNYFIEGRTMEEIAALEGITHQAISVRYKLIKARLAEISSLVQELVF